MYFRSRRISVYCIIAALMSEKLLTIFFIQCFSRLHHIGIFWIQSVTKFCTATFLNQVRDPYLQQPCLSYTFSISARYSLVIHIFFVYLYSFSNAKFFTKQFGHNETLKVKTKSRRKIKRIWLKAFNKRESTLIFKRKMPTFTSFILMLLEQNIHSLFLIPLYGLLFLTSYLLFNIVIHKDFQCEH